MKIRLWVHVINSINTDYKDPRAYGNIYFYRYPTAVFILIFRGSHTSFHLPTHVPAREIMSEPSAMMNSMVHK